MELNHRISMLLMFHFNSRVTIGVLSAIYLPYSKKLVVASAIAQTHHHILVLTLIVRKVPRIICLVYYGPIRKISFGQYGPSFGPKMTKTRSNSGFGFVDFFDR